MNVQFTNFRGSTLILAIGLLPGGYRGRVNIIESLLVIFKTVATEPKIFSLNQRIKL